MIDCILYLTLEYLQFPHFCVKPGFYRVDHPGLLLFGGKHKSPSYRTSHPKANFCQKSHWKIMYLFHGLEYYQLHNVFDSYDFSKVLNCDLTHFWTIYFRTPFCYEVYFPRYIKYFALRLGLPWFLFQGLAFRLGRGSLRRPLEIEFGHHTYLLLDLLIIKFSFIGYSQDMLLL